MDNCVFLNLPSVCSFETGAIPICIITNNHKILDPSFKYSAEKPLIVYGNMQKNPYKITIYFFKMIAIFILKTEVLILGKDPKHAGRQA